MLAQQRTAYRPIEKRNEDRRIWKQPGSGQPRDIGVDSWKVSPRGASLPGPRTISLRIWPEEILELLIGSFALHREIPLDRILRPERLPDHFLEGFGLS